MRGGRWRPSPLATVIALIVAAATVLGFVLTNRSVQAQNEALLRSDTTQAAGYVSSIVSGLGSTLQALASGINANGGSPVAFEVQAGQLSQGEFTFVLARKTGARYVVLAAVGPGFESAQVLGPGVTSALDQATSTIRPGLVDFNGRSTTAGLAIGPPAVPSGLGLYEQLVIDPFVATKATEAAPFHSLMAAVYGSRTPRQDQLVLANTRSLPLKGATSEAPVAVGSANWWLVAAARSPLAGGFPNAAPYVILAIGLSLALATGITVEALVRRQRYATRLVAVRTAELQASQDALVHGERLSALGEMASTIGHELRNPLGAVLNALFMVRHELQDALTPEAEHFLVMAEEQSARAVTISENVLGFVRQREPALAPLDLGEVVDDVLEATPTPPGVNVTVNTAHLEVKADRDQLTQVLANLVTNAYQAMPQGGTLTIEAGTQDHHAELTVADSGGGVDPAVLDRIFDPFFTTKATGTGLGLAIVSRIVEAHGGRVTFENRRRGGAVITVRLPLEPTMGPAVGSDQEA